MKDFTPADQFHRLIKEAVDSGEVASLEEALTLFQGFSIRLQIGDAAANDPNEQAALLTAVALAHRVFLGGVLVSGALEHSLLTQLPLGRTLAEAVLALGGQIGDKQGLPLITIGGGPQPRASEFHIRTACAGWRGGILPSDLERGPEAATVMPLAPLLAAALAVNEAFHFVRGSGSAIGRRALGLSLWNPAPCGDWLFNDDEPELCYLPTNLWLIGLGHLGQAYLWALGLLPYADPKDLRLVLQDTDVITPSTESTSILSNSTLVGHKKTRAMADWSERRGFKTIVVERLFAADFHRQPEEPCVALCGLDNALGRQALDQVGFDFVVEAGLGRGHRDFRTIRLHTLPGSRTAAQIWAPQQPSHDASTAPAYKKLLREGKLDQCGVTLLSGKAVGAAFVGAVAASLAVSQVLRLLHGGSICQLIDIDLQAIEYRVVVPHPSMFGTLNPGYVLTKPTSHNSVVPEFAQVFHTPQRERERHA